MENSKINVVEYEASLKRLTMNFNSGNHYLDNFIKYDYAINKNIGKTFVFLDNDNDSIIGYYNIEAGDLEYYDSGIRKKMGGAVHINFFALDENYHGILLDRTENGSIVNLSDVLLIECIERINKIRNNHIGFGFITLNSTKEGLSLYERNGFELLEEDMSFSMDDSETDCVPMYYLMDLK